MIDFRNQDLLPFSKAAAEYPGNGVHVSTLHRHRLYGVRGIRLEAVLIGGRWFTTRTAIEQFIGRLNEPAATMNSSSIPSPASMTLAEAEKNLENERF
jgi:Protein of unknown function (DUF1580)